MKKGLVIAVVLLFINVIMASSNLYVVKASEDNDLVEVTAQACSIQGHINTTVKLTREQYQDLEQYLDEFRAKLNQTTTREEARNIFKEAIVELDTYGLLPKGMTGKQVQNLVLGGRFQSIAQNFLKTIQIIFHKDSSISSNVVNLFCYFYAHRVHAFEDNIWQLIAELLTIHDLKIFWLLASFVYEYSQVKPIRFMNRLWVAGPGIGGYTIYYFTVGLLGTRWGSNDLGTAYGFSGIKLTLDGHSKAMYFGFTLLATK